QGYMYGAAALTQSTGQFYQDIEQAKLTREQVKRSNIETTKAQLQFERDYEANRPGLQDYRENDDANELRIARGNARTADIDSGRVPNTLLKSCIASGRIAAGPMIPLEQNVLRGINVRPVGTTGNLGMVKGGATLTWPLPLLETPYDGARGRFTEFYG